MSENSSEPWALHVLSTCRYLQNRLEQAKLMATLGFALDGGRGFTPLSHPRACVEVLEELSEVLDRLVCDFFGGDHRSPAPSEGETRARLRVLVQGLRDEVDAELPPERVAKRYGSPPPAACERLQQTVDRFGKAADRLTTILASRSDQ